MTLSRIGRYEIEKELGRGAMAVVYKAVDPIIGRVVAIKTIRVEHGIGMGREELLKRLFREAKSAGNLSHPNIVTIYDIGEEGEVSYIAMEYVEGEPLEAWMARHRIPPLEQTTSVVEQIASGLDYAAVRGIIHRDIKPGNILMTSDLRVKIADFGIAKISMSDITQTGLVMGTPSYMSPEQAMGRDLDGRSDLFSLGIIFYEMLTGERPFSGTNATTIIYKIIHEEPVPPRKLNVSLHPGFDYIVQKMLAKDPAQRYQSCAEFIQDLKNYTTLGTAPSPKIPTAAQEAAPAPQARRSYVVPAAAGVVIIALLVLSVFLYLKSQTLVTPVEVPGPTLPAVTPPVQAQKEPPPSSPPQLVEPISRPETKKESEPAKPTFARIRVQFTGPTYPVVLYDGTQRLGDSGSSIEGTKVPAGEHRFRIVSEEVYLDRKLERVKLKPDQLYPIEIPGLASAYVEVPDDAYDGCEILLNGKKLPTPYPALVRKLVAGQHDLAFRWTSGRYAGKEFSSSISATQNRHLLVMGDPKTERVAVHEQVR